MGIIEEAIARQDARPEARRIDYERARKSGPKLKAALTRATKSGDPEKVALACKRAVREWDEIGCWPDNWALWQAALDSCLFPHQIDIREL